MRDLTCRAVAACRDYELWASEVRRLTVAIGEVECPNEAKEPPQGGEWFFDPESHFAIARREPVGPEDVPSLDEVERRVQDCEACVRLCRLIRERQHARQRFGVAKRAVRHVGKLVAMEAGDA